MQMQRKSTALDHYRELFLNPVTAVRDVLNAILSCFLPLDREPRCKLNSMAQSGSSQGGFSNHLPINAIASLSFTRFYRGFFE